MMADLMHQHMPDDRTERFVVLGPVVEDRAPVEPDHVRHLHRSALRAERQADALEQAEQVEIALGAHVIEYLLARKIVDLNDEVFAEIAKSAGQMAEYFGGEDFELGERGRFYSSEGEWIRGGIGHNPSVAWIAFRREWMDHEAAMTVKPPSILALAALPGIVALAAVGMAVPAVAQAPPPSAEGASANSTPVARPRIEVNPRPLYRRCASRYVVQYRLSGPVLFPEKHCWWVRG
jgi:hypothetical protein